jgi:hypothetical protein
VISDPSAQHGPDRHPAEEAGEDGCHGLGRIAENENKLPRPDDLVDESGGPRQDKDEDDQAATQERVIGRGNG